MQQPVSLHDRIYQQERPGNIVTQRDLYNFETTWRCHIPHTYAILLCTGNWLVWFFLADIGFSPV